jgi:hypothetical protein
MHSRVIPLACLIAAVAVPTGGTALRAQTVLTERPCTGCVVRLAMMFGSGRPMDPA